MGMATAAIIRASMTLRQLAHDIRRFLLAPEDRRRLLVEASLRLLLARVALKVWSFKRVVSSIKRRPSGLETEGRDRERLGHDIAWAIRAAARRLPGTTPCFAEGLAAQAMLRKRGVDAVLYYGAMTDAGRGLTAHVWVRDQGRGIVGHEIPRPERPFLLKRLPPCN